MVTIIRSLFICVIFFANSAVAIETEGSFADPQSALPMNAFSQEAKLRSQLFESVSKKYGFKEINGRFGGEFNNDQLAIKEQDGRTILLLGLKATGPSGDLQLDQMSMGPFLQFSADWVKAVIECLKIDRQQYITAFQIELARNTKKLDLVVLLFDRVTKETKFLAVGVPN
jgi:hypothetical protein